MNLLTLQICKEEAEKMINDPHAWTSDFRMSPYAASKIREQGNRTLEVINAYRNVSKERTRLYKEVKELGG